MSPGGPRKGPLERFGGPWRPLEAFQAQVPGLRGEGSGVPCPGRPVVSRVFGVLAIVAVFFLEAAAKILHRCVISCARRVGREVRPVWADTKSEREKFREKPFSEICAYTGACTLEKTGTLPMFSTKSGFARALVFRPPMGFRPFPSGVNLDFVLFLLFF